MVIVPPRVTLIPQMVLAHTLVQVLNVALVQIPEQVLHAPVLLEPARAHPVPEQVHLVAPAPASHKVATAIATAIAKNPVKIRHIKTV
jgi:hypothetical protein